MSCETWTYRNVDNRVFACLRNQALKQGFHIPDSPTGKFRLTVAGMNIIFQFQWNAAAKTLRLTCIQKPFIVGCQTVKGHADQIIRGCGGIA